MNKFTHGVIGGMKTSSLKVLRKSLARNEGPKPSHAIPQIPEVVDVVVVPETVEEPVVESTVDIVECGVPIDKVIEELDKVIEDAIVAEELEATRIEELAEEVYGGPLVAEIFVDEVSKKRSRKYPKCAHPGCKKNRWTRGKGFCGKHYKESTATS